MLFVPNLEIQPEFKPTFFFPKRRARCQRWWEARRWRGGTWGGRGQPCRGGRGRSPRRQRRPPARTVRRQSTWKYILLNCPKLQKHRKHWEGKAYQVDISVSQAWSQKPTMRAASAQRTESMLTAWLLFYNWYICMNVQYVFVALVYIYFLLSWNTFSLFNSFVSDVSILHLIGITKPRKNPFYKKIPFLSLF